jgi:Tol biopolymer transport system component
MLSLLFSYGANSQKRYDVCYSYGLNIFVFSQADKKEDTLDVIGADPSLSPDGTSVAYTKYENGGDRRRIMCVDLASGKTTLLDPCKHCFGPVWSPDGKHIVYNDFDGDQWYILLLDLDGKAAPADLPRALITKGGFSSPTWSDDGKKILVQDMTNVFILDLTGRIIDSIPITRLRKDPAINGGSRYTLSRDETRIIFDMELDPAQVEDNPPGAIYVYDRGTQKTRPVSPNGYLCFQPVLKGDRIFFCGWKVGDPAVDKKTFVGNIYSLAMDGSDFRLEFKNRRDFSYRR